MSVIAYAADSVLTSAVNGRLVDPTSYLDSEAGTSAPNATPAYSASFSLNGVTLSAIAIKGSSRNAVAQGTITLVLRNITDGVDAATVTCNVADIPANAAQGWIFFLLAAPFTGVAGKLYAVGLVTDGLGSGRLNVFRDGTANNWSRLLRTTTAQAPVNGDQCLIVGEISGPSTTTTRTVTMDSDGTLVPGSVSVGFNANLNWDTTAGVTRNLKLSGYTRSDGVTVGLTVFTGGTINIGSSGTPYPSTSTAIIDLLCGSNVAYGIEWRGGTVNTYGAPTTLQCFLAQDYVAGSTVLNLTVNGGGNLVNVKAGALVALAQGSTNGAGLVACESFTLAVDPTGPLQITLPSGLVNDRLNVATYPVEVLILTTNVKIRGASNTLQTYCNVQANSTWTARYTECKWLGSATGSKRGIDVAATVASFDMQNCVLREIGVTLGLITAAASSIGVLFGSNLANPATFSNNVGYALGSGGFLGTSTLQSKLTVSGNWAGPCLAGNAVIQFSGVPAACNNNRVFGGQSAGLIIGETNVALGACTGNVAHNCGSVGARIANVAGGSASGWLCFKNTTADLSIQGNRDLLSVDNSVFAWSPGDNVLFDAANYAPVVFTSCLLKRGLSGTLTPGGVGINSVSAYATFRNCTIEAVKVVDNAASFHQITFDNCLFPNATTDVGLPATALTGSYVAFQNYNQVSGATRIYRPEGTRSSDTVIFDAGTKSVRMTPSNASLKLPTHTFQVPVQSGQTPTFNIRVRKSAVGDGAAYNGNQPRLVLRQRYAMGVTTDTVLATYAAGTGSWNTMTGTLPAAPRDGVYELFVDCDGTAGWINVDTATVIGAANDGAGTAKYWTADAAPLPLIARAVPLSGQIGLLAGISGTPKIDRRLSGSTAVAVGVSGTVKAERKLSGTLAVTAGVSGTPRVERKLSGTVTITIGVQGTLRSRVPPIIRSTGFILRAR